MWFRRRRRNEEIKDPDKALMEAEKSLKEIQKIGDEVTETADKLKQIRERNHFAEQMEELILRRRGIPE